MADNNEYIPQITYVPRYNEYVNTIIRGQSNIVEPSADDVIVSGDRNYVGQGCRNISLLNSSGCVVYPNVVGSTLINCSGIVIQEDNLVYINNNRLTNITGGVSEPKLIGSNYQATVNDDVLFIDTAGVIITFPHYSDVGGKEWRVKNISTGDAYIYTSDSGGFDNESPVINTVTLAPNDAYSLKAYYVSIYIL